MNNLCLIKKTLVEKASALAFSSMTNDAFATNVLPAGYSSFTAGSLGNFPYYWQDPNNLRFNESTYRWISSNLQARSNPIKQDGIFTNLFLQALSKIVYTLSKADQNKLTAARNKASQEQHALLLAWQTAFGNIPLGTPNNPAIDLIVENIVTQWAIPSTDLHRLVNSSDPKSILNNIPQNGNSVLPALISYLKSFSTELCLLNSVTKYNGLLIRAISAIQNPNSENGGLLTSDDKYVPSYKISPSVADIITGLSNQSSKQTINLALKAQPVNNNLHIDTDEHQALAIQSSEILSIQKNHSKVPIPLLSLTSDSSHIDVNFKGGTTVEFSPTHFSQNSFKNWFWIEPISEAITNGDLDKSGYKFSPKPNIDFSKNGDFGFLNNIIISNHPIIKISTSDNNAKKIETHFMNNSGHRLTFLNRELGAINSPDGYSVIRKGKEITLKMNNNLPSNANMQSRAYVLCVISEFPAAS